MDAGRRAETGTRIETLSLLYEICLKSDHRSGSAEGSRPSAGVWGTLSGGQCEGAPVSPAPRAAAGGAPKKPNIVKGNNFSYE